MEESTTAEIGQPREAEAGNGAEDFTPSRPPVVSPIDVVLRRRQIRRDFTLWCQYCGYEPAQHHRLLIETMVAATERKIRNVIFLLPPGSAKSTYTSVLFPPWYLCRRPTDVILACSYSFSLIEGFGKRCRNLIDQHEKTLGYSLSTHSAAAGDWETSLGGRYFCAGVGAGLAGHRADFGLIDDYIGSEEDADSKIVREKQWAWYNNDFFPRLKPNAVQFIVANRRHEEDLVGMLLSSQPGRWVVIKLPFFAKESDPLGRSVGDRLWPEWFTEEQALTIKGLPARTQAGLYQQEPAPEEGSYFLRDWFIPYHSLNELPNGLRNYMTGDFAVTEDGASPNRTCLLPAGVQDNGHIWLYPDAFWKVAGPKETIRAFVDMVRRRQPLAAIVEKGQILKSIGPFLKEALQDEDVYVYLQEVAATRAKDVRAQSIRGRASLKTIHVPVFAQWWSDALHELLTFPGGKYDDFVDALAYMGLALQDMNRGSGPPPADPVEDLAAFHPLTLGWVKRADKDRKRSEMARYGGR